MNSGRFRGEINHHLRDPGAVFNDFGDGPVVGFTSFFWGKSRKISDEACTKSNPKAGKVF